MKRAQAQRIALFLIAVTLTACLVLLTGCAEVAAMRAAGAQHGAEAADQAVDTALWSLCNAAPVGAIQRRFKTPDEREAYGTLCGHIPP